MGLAAAIELTPACALHFPHPWTKTPAELRKRVFLPRQIVSLAMLLRAVTQEMRVAPISGRKSLWRRFPSHRPLWPPCLLWCSRRDGFPGYCEPSERASLSERERAIVQPCERVRSLWYSAIQRLLKLRRKSLTQLRATWRSLRRARLDGAQVASAVALLREPALHVRRWQPATLFPEHGTRLQDGLEAIPRSMRQEPLSLPPHLAIREPQVQSQAQLRLTAGLRFPEPAAHDVSWRLQSRARVRRWEPSAGFQRFRGTQAGRLVG